MRKLFVLGAAVVLAASTAYAAPNVTNSTQKGSALIYADINVSRGHTTIVRMVNDGDLDKTVHCVFSDAGAKWEIENGDVGGIKQKNWNDFEMRLTARQPWWCDAGSGYGSKGVGTCPGFTQESPWQKGELICWVTNLTGDKKQVYNHLAGTGTVIDWEHGSAYEYNASAFFLRATGLDNTKPYTLSLDGKEYDLCPTYLIGQFSPVGVSLYGKGHMGLGLAVDQNRLTISSCTQEPWQDGNPKFTKLQFEIWNANEDKRTGTYRCSDSWWETLLGQDPRVYNEQNFSYRVLGSTAAYYRVQGVSSSECAGSKDVGMVGVQSYDLVFGKEHGDGFLDGPYVFAAVGANAAQAGNPGRAGVIQVGPPIGTEEGAIR